MRAASILAMVLVAACDAPVAAPDAAAPDAGPPGPAAAAPPSMLPCPSGWRELRTESGIALCDPWPESGRADGCAFGEAHLPGTAGCARIGTACPGDGWPAGLPTDRPIVWVDDDAAAGGDGASRETALRSPRDATAIAEPGAVIALATGRYEGGVSLLAGQTLWGACVAETRLAVAAYDENRASVRAIEDGTGVRNVGFEGGMQSAIYVYGNDVVIEDVAIASVPVTGISIEAGSATVRRAAIRDVAYATGERWGHCVYAARGTAVVIEGAVAERCAAAGAMTTGGRIEASDVALLEAGERGAHAQDAGSTIVLRRAWVGAARGVAIMAYGEGARLEASDAVVTGTRQLPEGVGGRAFDAQSAGTLVLERARIEASVEFGGATSAGGRLELRDVAILGNDVVPGSVNGTGLIANGGATVHVERVAIEHAALNGVYLGGPGVALDGSDLTVRDTASGPATGMFGNAIVIADTAGATLSRVLLERARQVALGITDASSAATIEDLVIRDTLPQESDATSGRGLELALGSRLTIVRGTIEGSRTVGVFVSESTELVATDLAIVGSRPQESDGRWGVGLWAQDDAVVELTRTRVEGAHFAGLAAVGARITASELAVHDVRESGCGSTTCAEISGGFGVAAQFGAAVSATGFEIRGAALCGVVVGRDDPARDPTAMDLARGVIADAPVGACVQVEGFDASRLRQDVEYRDVGAPLQATSYELPSAL